MRARRLVAVALATLVVASAAIAGPLTPAVPAQAAFAAEFDPGNIISDQVFYAAGTMSAAQVQAFLTTKGSGCAAGQQPCLKDYVGTSVAEPIEAGLCNGYADGQTQSAAQMIVGVASSCGINPQVLLVLLEKEQSLVTGTRPSTTAYRAATGFGCPDTSGCDPQYGGLFKQLYRAARQFQVYAMYPTRYGYQAGRPNNILYNPNSNCGYASVTIANQATAGLYDYTPYQPNAAALANLYGTGDSCSSYGNRNFWRLFTDWFGSTHVTSYLMRSTAPPNSLTAKSSRSLITTAPAAVASKRRIEGIFSARCALPCRANAIPQSRMALTTDSPSNGNGPPKSSPAACQRRGLP